MKKELGFHRNSIRLVAEHLLVQSCLASAFSSNRAVAERAEKQLFLELERITGPCEGPAEECSGV